MVSYLPLFMDLFKSTGGNRYLLLCTGIFNFISFYCLLALPNVLPLSILSVSFSTFFFAHEKLLYLLLEWTLFVFIRWIAIFDVIILSDFTFEMQDVHVNCTDTVCGSYACNGQCNQAYLQIHFSFIFVPFVTIEFNENFFPFT